MQPFDAYEMMEMPQTGGHCLSADEIGTLVQLMQELRDVTLSRATFEQATSLIARLTGNADQPRLVAADALEH